MSNILAGHFPHDFYLLNNSNWLSVSCYFPSSLRQRQLSSQEFVSFQRENVKCPFPFYFTFLLVSSIGNFFIALKTMTVNELLQNYRELICSTADVINVNFQLGETIYLLLRFRKKWCHIRGVLWLQYKTIKKVVTWNSSSDVLVFKPTETERLKWSFMVLYSSTSIWVHSLKDSCPSY